MNTEIFENYEAFMEREDKSVNGVSPDFAERFPNYKVDNETNTGCWNCKSCKNCIDCDDCESCTNCKDCEYRVYLRIIL